MSAVDWWRTQLLAWAIPEEILARAPESPYGFPAELMRHRTERAITDPSSPSIRRAREALPQGGTVLDVGVGAGAASLPLADRASRLVGIDESERMLDAFTEAAARIGVASATAKGRWPDVASSVDAADVLVCHHVLYNVQDLEPFVLALDERAVHRVVVEITDRHPWAWMAPLWLRFHGLTRPEGPTADDAEAAIAEIGIPLRREERTAGPTGGFERRADAVALMRRRLCLSPARDPEVEEALGDLLAESDGLWSAGPRDHAVVTFWWDAGV